MLNKIKNIPHLMSSCRLFQTLPLDVMKSPVKYSKQSSWVQWATEPFKVLPDFVVNLDRK